MKYIAITILATVLIYAEVATQSRWTEMQQEKREYITSLDGVQYYADKMGGFYTVEVGE